MKLWRFTKFKMAYIFILNFFFFKDIEFIRYLSIHYDLMSWSVKFPLQYALLNRKTVNSCIDGKLSPILNILNLVISVSCINLSLSTAVICHFNSCRFWQRSPVTFDSCHLSLLIAVKSNRWQLSSVTFDKCHLWLFDNGLTPITFDNCHLSLLAVVSFDL